MRENIKGLYAPCGIILDALHVVVCYFFLFRINQDFGSCMKGVDHTHYIFFTQIHVSCIVGEFSKGLEILVLLLWEGVM